MNILVEIIINQIYDCKKNLLVFPQDEMVLRHLNLLAYQLEALMKLRHNNNNLLFVDTIFLVNK